MVCGDDRFLSKMKRRACRFLAHITESLCMSVRIGIGDEGSSLDELRLGIADSGASDFLEDSSLNPYLRNSRPSRKSYQTAGSGTIRGDLD